MPIAERPEEDRDEVLYPAVERRETASSRRKMGGCRVVEDADQDVDRDENPEPAEKDQYINGNPLICGPARGSGLPRRHLSSPPGWTLEVVRVSDRFAGQYPGCGDLRARRLEVVKLVAYAWVRDSLRTQDVVPVTKI